MAGELLQKIEKLRDIVFKKNNEKFTKSAVEVLNPDNVDEGLFGSSGEEHTVGIHAEKEMEAECISVERALRKSISEEEEAAANYLGRAKKALENDDHSLYVLYKELAADEMVHAAQLQAVLDIYGLANKAAEIKGRLEAHTILGANVCEAKEKEDENAKKQRKLREKADKAAKDFDFVAEYTKGRLEQARQKVVGAINDLIIGKDDLEGTLDKIMKDGKKIVKKQKSTKKESDTNEKD